jgi:uncharacterized membrane protein
MSEAFPFSAAVDLPIRAGQAVATTTIVVAVAGIVMGVAIVVVGTAVVAEAGIVAVTAAVGIAEVVMAETVGVGDEERHNARR